MGVVVGVVVGVGDLFGWCFLFGRCFWRRWVSGWCLGVGFLGVGFLGKGVLGKGVMGRGVEGRGGRGWGGQWAADRWMERQGTLGAETPDTLRRCSDQHRMFPPLFSLLCQLL